ncbi:hypothetical protein H6F44_05965 [Pseudanabaena sp. FACHB-1277]|uniref:Uncharacterized protein n=1 Tax=Pseudanabaena cinerea FACHB-1277 TaxID=2949581 RepID=A0A926URX7_9CYAN|nr:hypothetical protein [Pseudanabaena cinerea]MBD2149671.1 hypothetical protein [Pseudanabaena cinerea FACHB-1277]
MRQQLALAIAAYIGTMTYLSHCCGHSLYANEQKRRSAADLEIDRQIIDRSPVLQRWLNSPPDLLDDIYNSPSFDSKLRIGITSRNHSLGLELGIEDIFIGKLPVTFNANVQAELSGRESEINANFRYYLLPLGSYWNVAPVVGYRQFNQFERPQISGLDVGVQGILVLSPQSSDLRLSHTFTSPQSNLEMSITTLSSSYALTNNLRLGTKIEWRRSPIIYDSRVGFLLELTL